MNADRLFDSIDKNHDGKITREEFMKSFNGGSQQMSQVTQFATTEGAMYQQQAMVPSSMYAMAPPSTTQYNPAQPVYSSMPAIPVNVGPSITSLPQPGPMSYGSQVNYSSSQAVTNTAFATPPMMASPPVQTNLCGSMAPIINTRPPTPPSSRPATPGTGFSMPPMQMPASMPAMQMPPSMPFSAPQMALAPVTMPPQTMLPQAPPQPSMQMPASLSFSVPQMAPAPMPTPPQTMMAQVQSQPYMQLPASMSFSVPQMAPAPMPTPPQTILPQAAPAPMHSATDALFDALDRNHDGKLSREEIEAWQRSQGLPPATMTYSSMPASGYMALPSMSQQNFGTSTFQSTTNTTNINYAPPFTAPTVAPPVMVNAPSSTFITAPPVIVNPKTTTIDTASGYSIPEVSTNEFMKTRGSYGDVMREAAALFDMLDRNGDGYISRGEFEHLSALEQQQLAWVLRQRNYRERFCPGSIREVPEPDCYLM